jgi:uncharacterized protein (TIGR02453 family)
MWPREALEFLRELEDNNDREWFKANRARYDAHLVEPGRALAASVAHLGEARFFRPYNDARFQSRPPLKEQFGIAIGSGGACGFYVELSLDGLLVGAGLHHPATDQLERFRAAIDDDRRAAGFERALRGARAARLEMIEATGPITRASSTSSAGTSRSIVATTSSRGCTSRPARRACATSSTPRGRS